MQMNGRNNSSIDELKNMRKPMPLLPMKVVRTENCAHCSTMAQNFHNELRYLNLQFNESSGGCINLSRAKSQTERQQT